ncbi:MAG: type II secretion system F family protein [Gemmatimonadota bacterium]|nr:type II secretion system F family protein [Gemmatimonadota bacterium]
MSAPRASAAIRWRYEAADAHGAITRGEVDAATADEAVAALRRRALWVIDLTPADEAGTDGAAAPAPVGRTADGMVGGMADGIATRLQALWDRVGGGRDEALLVSTRTLATLLEAGVPLTRALAFAASGDTDPHWRAVFAGLQEAVARGESLSDAAARVPSLPPRYAPLLAAAEASGSMAATVDRLANDLEQRGALRARVQAALVYPTVLATASVLGTLVILVVVVPRFADLIADAGGTVPASTRALIALSDALARAGWWLVGAGVLGAAAVRQWLRDPRQRLRWHTARLHWPLTGRFEQEQAAAAYLSTLAVALESGVPLLRAMPLARGTVGNAALAARLTGAEAVVRDGGSVAQSLSGTLPPLAVRLLEAGEQGGALAPLARRAADAAAAQVQRLITRAVALIEPAMILGFGGVVGFVALALLQAIYGLNASSF